MMKKKDNPADELYSRASKQNISIAELCRLAGVSRNWFERFKKRVPKAVKAYIKMNERLKELESHNENQK